MQRYPNWFWWLLCMAMWANIICSECKRLLWMDVFQTNHTSSETKQTNELMKWKLPKKEKKKKHHHHHHKLICHIFGWQFMFDETYSNTARTQASSKQNPTTLVSQKNTLICSVSIFMGWYFGWRLFQSLSNITMRYPLRWCNFSELHWNESHIFTC